MSKNSLFFSLINVHFQKKKMAGENKLLEPGPELDLYQNYLYGSTVQLKYLQFVTRHFFAAVADKGLTPLPAPI